MTSAGMNMVRRRARGAVCLASAGVMAATLAACGGSGSSSASSTASGASGASAASSSGGSGAGKIKVALILKEFTNPYWISMEKTAKQEAAKKGVTLHVTAGNSDDDTTSQITQIEQAVAAGDKGIIIALNGDAVNKALTQAKAAGLVVVAVDTPPIPGNIADVTYATDNTAAGVLDGKWAAAKLNGKSADIAMLDDLANQVITVDVDRDHGFLNGMGIPVGNPNVNGKEPTSGKYTGGKGGTYKIACQLPTNGATTGGQTAMETCLSKDSNINLVYAINEPAAEGAAHALKSAGKTGVTVVAIDGGCSNLPFVKSGEIGATAGQFPGKMALEGVDAIAQFAKTGKKPTNQAGKDYFNTGTKLYTDSPQSGVPSITTAAASKVCWG
ncbi:sugar ABC transporter substrate-binding protein [Leekyejoonella antrihumi]|uniref:Sugar ABC transporter substrate-binding protein n=2 Tax=Leekyejoonella antrihumi TaxID=1660198 RepID=A0A563DZN0_9MICO|nr:sugar ABC transporter substrate-binding protein [Leekyejoonella antrihumi]